MNEILVQRYTKKVMKYGISKDLAKEISLVSVEASKGKNVDMYIKYAIDLNFGYGLSANVVII